MILCPIRADDIQLAYLIELRVHTNVVLYLYTMPAGFVLTVMGVIKLWRRKLPAALLSQEGV